MIVFIHRNIKKPVANNEKKRKEILTNLTINKCTLHSIITHHNTNTQYVLNN